MAREDLAALLAKVQADLAVVKKGSGERKVREICADAEKSREDRERSRKVMLAVESAERAERERFVAVPKCGQHGKGLRAKSGEALPEYAAVAEHRINRGEIAWKEIVKACQDTQVKDREGSEIPDETLERRLDNLEAKRAKRASARG